MTRKVTETEFFKSLVKSDNFNTIMYDEDTSIIVPIKECSSSFLIPNSIRKNNIQKTNIKINIVFFIINSPFQHINISTSLYLIM